MGVKGKVVVRMLLGFLTLCKKKVSLIKIGNMEEVLFEKRWADEDAVQLSRSCHNYVEFEMLLRYPSGNVDEVIRYVGIKLKRISKPEKKSKIEC